VDERLGLVLAGDVMTGRGVDQGLAHPGDPGLAERSVTDARDYVRLAERVGGRVPQPVDPTWPWGASLAVMADFGPAVRVMNLETSITRSEERAPRKAVHYRMSPENLAVLSVAEVDVWTLANNHVLDHGVSGLRETLHALRGAGMRSAGAGEDAHAAWRPAVAGQTEASRVLVASCADTSSGVPRSWAAQPGRPGVALLDDLSERSADAVAELLVADERPGDLRVASVHWGSNWGYEVPSGQRRFAHRLIDAGAHVVHGHSSHHPRPAEVYRGGLVLYGCGDLVNDYEGIGGYEQFRDDLRLLYLVRLERGTGRLESLRMVPLRARRLSLERARTIDTRWLARVLDGASRELRTRVVLGDDEVLEVCPA
jgi:poly-gamma-glutamate synthesis protein (capsule biosynthesis protein)